MNLKPGCAALVAATLLAACGGSQDGGEPSAASSNPPAAAPSKTTTRLALPPSLQAPTKVDRRLAAARGPVEVWVSLSEPSMAAMQAQRATALGLASDEGTGSSRASRLSARPDAGTAAARESLRAQIQAHRGRLAAQQAAVRSALASLGASELARVSAAHNAIAVRVDASRLAQVGAIAGVLKVRPVIHHKLHLSETVPYVGARALQQSGFDGTGVTVAVIDSGVDYTHRNLGGPGTAEAYAQAAGTGPGDPAGTTGNALFPNAKVVGGYDFLGEAWPSGPVAPDANPVDYWFHGTHVADITAGSKGVAPGAKIVALKACSSVSPSCNGIALLRSMDYAVDPNGDDDFADAVDVINLSLGSDYGQPEDDLSFAVKNAVDLGVVVVASAGNGGNVATVVGSPSSEPGAISVAQTEVPSARAPFVQVTAPASIARRIADVGEADWAPVTAAVSGAVAYVGRGCPVTASTPTADTYLGDPAGKIALIDRGACDFSAKVDRAARAGARAALIGLVAPGAPFGLALGAGSQFVPVLMIPFADSDAIKDAIIVGGATVNVTLDTLAVQMAVRPTSARGPSNAYNAIKPEIGAPGASVSASVGTGTGEAVFGGTSGAAPMVAGAVAQLLQAHPNRSPLQIKAMLMNTAYTQIASNPLTEPGVLAPIARIGAGELRVDRAAKTGLIAFNTSQSSAALSFGFQSVSSVGVYTEQLRLRNFGAEGKRVRIRSEFRYDDDRANGAVRINVPGSVFVPGNGSVSVPVILSVDGRKLPDWAQDGSDLASAGRSFSANEYDGYLTLEGGGDSITVPWHILPRKSSALIVAGGGTTRAPVALINAGVQEATTEIFALTGSSPRATEAESPDPGDNRAFVDMRSVGARLAAPGIVQFGIASHGRRSNAFLPGGFEVQVDANRDGFVDYAVYNAEIAPDSGILVVFVYDFGTGLATPYFYVDADFYSGNMTLTAPLAAMGLTDAGTFDFVVLSYDNYFTGAISDVIGPMTFTPATPKFDVLGDITQTVAPGRSLLLRTVPVAGGDLASPSQTGLLMLHRGDAGRESAEVTLRR